jgi:hypothetical protein
MVLPAHTVPASGAPAPCALDRHVGPFDPVEELRGALGTDWYRCRRCRSLLTRVSVGPARVAA